MDKSIAYCGISCQDCPTFNATQNDNDRDREKVARHWSKLFTMNLQASDINCDGCRETGRRLFGHCTNCQIRTCAQNRNIESCAYCPDYACDSLKGFLSILPTSNAKDNLEALRKQHYGE